MPKISVITATFNACDGLRQTVASVRGQTFADIEHVIVDGGSTDGTVEFLQSLGSSVTWVSEPDDGIADAMNKGIEMSRGEFIIFLHAGDTFVDEKTIGGVAHLLSDEVDLLSLDVIKTQDGQDVGLYRSKGFGPTLEFFMTVPHQGLFCRSEIFARIGGFDSRVRVAMDYDFMLRAKRHGARIRVVNIPLARMPDDGVSSRLDWLSVSSRLNENRTVQARQLSGPVARLAHAIFWSLYPVYKRAIVAFKQRSRAARR